MNRTGLDWRFIARILGMTLILESFFMLCTWGVALIFKEWDASYLLLCSGCCLFGGIAFAWLGNFRERVKMIGKRESFLSVTLSWLLFAIFGAFPFYISGVIPSYTDAFFETMSGFTTTGATILDNMEIIPRGLLFWRSLIQWLGGLGVVVFSLAFLPLFGAGASQLFEAETTGLTHDKFRPRAAQVAKRIWMIYMGFTIILVLLLYAGPMDLFDAVCHAFTTISTGGYSTRQASLAHWNSLYLEVVIMLFMIIGSINFALYYFLLKKNFKRFFRDEELHWFLGLIVMATIVITGALMMTGSGAEFLGSFRTALFQVVSLITTTGFYTSDYASWEPFFWTILLMLMVVCGCAGSTTGGLKVVRFVVLIKNTLNEFGRLIHPRAVIPVRLNGNVLSMDIVQRLLAFAFLYVSILVVSVAVLLFSGMTFEEAVGAAVASIGNIGPGLGAHGPVGSFAGLSVFIKWYLSFLMLVGRLEIFTVLILFTPGFWKK